MPKLILCCTVGARFSSVFVRFHNKYFPTCCVILSSRPLLGELFSRTPCWISKLVEASFSCRLTVLFTLMHCVMIQYFCIFIFIQLKRNASWLFSQQYFACVAYAWLVHMHVCSASSGVVMVISICWCNLGQIVHLLKSCVLMFSLYDGLLVSQITLRYQWCLILTNFSEFMIWYDMIYLLIKLNKYIHQILHLGAGFRQISLNLCTFNVAKMGLYC